MTASGMPMTQRVYFIFAFRELPLLEKLHPLLMRLRELDPTRSSSRST